MAVKNMQTLEMLSADLQGVSVTGMECKGSLRTDGTIQAPILSVFRLPLPGPYPTEQASAVTRKNAGVLRIRDKLRPSRNICSPEFADNSTR